MEIIRRKKFNLGVILVFLGILMPLIIDIYTFDIQKMIEFSVRNDDKIHFIFAAILLVFLNSIRAFPHYIGAFFISESVKFKNENSVSKFSKSIIISIIIPVVYFIIKILYKYINYHFGFPAITIIILLILIGSREYNYISEWKKVCLIIFLITALQFLDITPVLDVLPFGQGDSSREIKLISTFFQIEGELNIISVSFFLLFMLFSFLLFLLIKEENRLKVLDVLKAENLMLENEAKIKDVENRAFLEIKSLVHDLKSPLTSAQVLVSLVKNKCEELNLNKEIEYIDSIDNSIDSMSKMVSEILSEDASFIITTEELINSTLANISKYDMSKHIIYYNYIPNKYVKVNKITFIRALVNLLENSFKAIQNVENGNIKVIVDSIEITDEPFIEISIIDNGIGVENKNINKVFKSGYTTSESYGLGLSFVKRTIEKAEGEIFFYSKKDIGTTVTILVKEIKNGK